MSIKTWILAARPKTLVAGVSPVLIASGLAIYNGVFKWHLALICLVIAILFQVVSNFANDYFDFKKGSDSPDRLGPKRAVAEGWVTPRQMMFATLITMALACCFGVLLMWLVDFRLLFVGIAVCIFAMAYSGGKYPLAYHGWGDLCVLLFYGVVPVVFTYYVQSLTFTTDAIICGFIAGIASINILVANNYRDYPSDKASNKRTTIVVFGKKFGKYFYLSNGIIALLLCQYFWTERLVFVALLPLIYILLHIRTWKAMITIGEGRALIAILGRTALNVLVLSILITVGFIIG